MNKVYAQMTDDELYEVIIGNIQKEIEAAKVDPQTYTLVKALYAGTKSYWDSHTGLPREMLVSLAESDRPLQDINEVVLWNMRAKDFYGRYLDDDSDDSDEDLPFA